MRTVNKILIGVAAGAILGILYAPNKGSITRRRLSRRGNDLRDKLNNLKDVMDEKIDTLKEDVNELSYHEKPLFQNEGSSNPDSWHS